MSFRVRGWVCVPHNADADHDWRIMSDSTDAGVWHWWECQQCGKIDEYREVESEDLGQEFYDYDY